MRTFVKYSRDGVVLAAIKVQTMPPHVDQPFMDLAEGEAALEVTGPLADADATVLHNGFQIDVKKKQLVKKSAPLGG